MQKTEGSWDVYVLKVQQTVARSTGFRVSSPEFLFNILQYYLLPERQTHNYLPQGMLII